jgi:hypothetical protein
MIQRDTDLMCEGIGGLSLAPMVRVCRGAELLQHGQQGRRCLRRRHPVLQLLGLCLPRLRDAMGGLEFGLEAGDVCTRGVALPRDLALLGVERPEAALRLLQRAGVLRLRPYRRGQHLLDLGEACLRRIPRHEECVELRHRLAMIGPELGIQHARGSETRLEIRDICVASTRCARLQHTRRSF